MMCGSYLGQFLSQQIDIEIQGHPQRLPDIRQSLVSGFLTSGAKIFTLLSLVLYTGTAVPTPQA